MYQQHERPINVLLVEDNPADARLLRENLADNRLLPFALTHIPRLKQVPEQLAEVHYDVILLDLSLPDAQGLETLLQARAHAPGVPIIVLTGTDDDALALKAVHAGAQDYLIKGQTETNLLVRAIRYAIERYRLQAELDHTRQREQQEREFLSLQRLSPAEQVAITAQMYGAIPIQKSLPEIFQTLVQRYSALLDHALEQRIYKVEHRVSANLQALANQLGFLKAGPRDVVEIHTTALQQKISGVHAEKYIAYAEEGRMMVLEFMGHLVSYYRYYAPDSGRPFQNHKGQGQ